MMQCDKCNKRIKKEDSYYMPCIASECCKNCYEQNDCSGCWSRIKGQDCIHIHNLK